MSCSFPFPRSWVCNRAHSTAPVSRNLMGSRGFSGGEVKSLIQWRILQTVKNLPVTQETQVQLLGWEDLLEKATHWSGQPTPVFSPGESRGWRSLAATVQGVTKSRLWPSDWHFAVYIKCYEEDKNHLPRQQGKGSTHNLVGRFSLVLFIEKLAQCLTHSQYYHWLWTVLNFFFKIPFRASDMHLNDSWCSCVLGG